MHHLPMTSSHLNGWRYPGLKALGEEGLAELLAGGSPPAFPYDAGAYAAPMVSEGLSGTTPPPGNFALLPQPPGLDELDAQWAAFGIDPLLPQLQKECLQLSSLIVGGPEAVHSSPTTMKAKAPSPKTSSVASSPVAGPAAGGPMTTIMLRNLPEGFTREALLELLDSQGFAGRYDFAYQPVNFDTLSGLSHAFVNMLSPVDAEEIRKSLDGFSEWAVPHENVCRVVWNDKQQGLAALVERYRNSPVMHESVPDSCKPVILLEGERQQFPTPTQKIKAPRIFKTKM